MRRAAILAALVCWTGCTQRPHAELVVVVMTDIAVPAGINRLEIEVHDARVPVDEPQVFDLEVSASDFPATLTLTSAGAAPRDITVTVTGLLGREPVVSERAITSFVAGPSRALVILLADACRPEVRACTEGESCQPDGCVSERRDGSTLPLTEDVLNGGGSPDGGVPDGGPFADGGSADGGPDAGTCIPTEEVCDFVDNDCDGITDESEGNENVQSSFDADVPHEHCGRCFNSCDRCVAGSCAGVRDIEAVVGSSCLVESVTPTAGTLACEPGADLAPLTTQMFRLEAGPLATAAEPGALCLIDADSETVSCIGDDYPNDAIAGCSCVGRCLSCPYVVTGARGTVVSPASDLAVGGRHACSVVDGAVYCWGTNERGQLGPDVEEGSIAFGLDAVRVDIPGGVRIAQVVSGAHFVCAREENGERRVFCWGAAEQGSLGRTSTSDENQTPMPALYPDGTPLADVVDVACVGGSAIRTSRNAPHCCAAHADGEVDCWGGSAYGQLDGVVRDRAPRNPPRRLLRPSGMGHVREVEVGPAVSCAVTVDDEVWCWGEPDAVLQQAAGRDHGPTHVLFDEPAPAIRDLSLSAGIADRMDAPLVFAMARSWSGEVYCWGSNEGLQCNGGGGDVTTPTLVTP